MLNWLPRNLASTGSRGDYQALSINPSKNFKGVTHVLTPAYCRPIVGRERHGDGADLRYQPERRLRQAHLRRTDGQARLRPRRGGWQHLVHRYDAFMATVGFGVTGEA